jgi:hypothetical protein
MPPDFNWRSYLNANPDVSNALGYTEEAANRHYLNNGQYENRPLTFDWRSYLNTNPDVSKELGYTQEAANKHYREFGHKENRKLSGPPSTPTPTPTGSLPAGIGARIPASEIAPTTAPVIYKGAIIPIYNQSNIAPNLVYEEANKKWIKTSGTENNKTDYYQNYKEKYDTYRTDYPEDYPEYTDDEKINEENKQLNKHNINVNNANFEANRQNKEASDNNKIANQKAKEFDQLNTNLNNQNIKKNSAFTKVYSIAANTTGGDYVDKRDMIRQLEKENLINQETKNKLEADFKKFYSNEKLTTWDPKTAAKPPSPDGRKELDVSFYDAQVPELKPKWIEAAANDDLDIIGRYNNNWKDYFAAHYTTQGRLNGIRGYKEETQIMSENYKETLLDTDKQRIKDVALGEGQYFDTLMKSILGPKEEEETKKYSALVQNTLKDTIAKLNKVKNQEMQWDVYRSLDGFSEVLDLNKNLANSIMGDSGIGGYLAVSKKKTTAELTTDLETQLEKTTGFRSNVTYNWQKWFDDQLVEKYGIDYKQFQAAEGTLDIVNTALTADVKKIYDKKDKKFTAEFVKKTGFNTSERLTEFLNKQGETGTNLLARLQNSNDSMPTELMPLKTNLEDKIKTLNTAKNRDVNLTYKNVKDIPEQVKIDASFARQFIDEYLKPRFDFSKSMDEFRDYLNVIEKDKNIFQTTDRLTEVKTYAESVAKAILPDLDKERFNYTFGQSEEDDNFYFNPRDNYAPPEMQAIYTKQKKRVNDDWNAAKINPDALIDGDRPELGTWRENAYLYNINVKDLSDKEIFGKLHYEIIGSLPAFNFDPAMNPSSTLKLKFENSIREKAEGIKTVFGEFTTPESYADTLLKNIDPLANKIEWKNLLNKYDLEEDATTEEIKKVIVDSLTSGTAEEIRTKIKELQELEETPTQKKLGVTYIERPEENLATDVEKTNLYKIFKDAGYTDTEKNFYTNYMTGTSPEDIKLLTNVTKGKLPEFDFTFDTKDPTAALNKLQELDTPTTKKTTKKTTDYFKIGLDDEEEEKETDSDSFLSDYAALFKK